MAVEVELKVKSGPGVIIGKIKFPIVNNVVDVTGIQFSDPGEYIISVIANSTEIENGEFTINISPEEEVIPQEDSNQPDEEPVNGKRPIIAQIDQPTIKLNPIEFEATPSDSDNQEIASSTGYTPLFSYNNSPIEARYIQKMTIYYEDFIPKCEIIFKDALGLINSQDTSPLNDTKFDIFLNSGSDVLKSIHLKFKLEVNQKNKSGTNTITGILDIPNYYKIGYKSYKGTSFESLRKIVKESQLGFNSNIDNTNDSMTWRRNGITTRDFMRNILNHSYISDDSFMVGYIDYYWSFNYVDVEKEWKRDISEDVGLISQGISSKSGDEVDRIVKMILTNDQASNSSPFFITNFVVNNNSTLQSTQKGNFTVSKTYDRIKKTFQKFNVDSLTSDTKEQVVLKGSPGDKDDIETNFRTSYGGKIDTTNVHQNWSYAVEQNKRNLTNLSNITLQADLPNPNYNLYKFQKIKINIVNQKQTTSDEKLFDKRISGDWIIIDIKFIWDGKKLKQSIICTRKELGKTDEEKENEIIEEDKSVNNSEINENPSEPDKPNQKYEIGKVYTLQGNDGVKYLYTITGLDDNGVDVIGDIKRVDGGDILSDSNIQSNISLTEQTTIEQQTATQSNTWIPGKRINRGSFNQGNIKVEWEVKNDNNIGLYESFVNNDDIGTFNDIKIAEDTAKEEAFKIFTTLINQNN
jgi:hypothetical protein